VAGRAGESGVRAGESKPGKFQVVEFCAKPGIGAMARLARGGE